MSEAYGILLAEHKALKSAYEALLLENKAHRAELRNVSDRLGDIADRLTHSSSAFIEGLGVLWHVLETEPPRVFACCPACRVPLTPFPPKSNSLLTCKKCGFVARDLQPDDVEKVALKIAS